MLIFLLIFSLIITGLPPTLYANKNDITPVAGDGTAGYRGNGGIATNARLDNPTAVAVDSDGNIYIFDQGNYCVRMVDADTGNISTLNLGSLGIPGSVAVDADAYLYVPGEASRIIMYHDGYTDSVSTEVYFPAGVAVNIDGSQIYFIDKSDSVVWKIDSTTEDITIVAGIPGASGYLEDGVQATGARLNNPQGVAVDTAGNLFIADTDNNRIRMVDAHTGFITTVAGNGTDGYSGDGHGATDAQLSYPAGAAVDGSGNLYIADTGNNRIRRVDAVTGDIASVGDDEFNQPTGVAIGGDGNLYIADSGSNTIQKVQLVPNTPVIDPNGGDYNTAQTVAIGNISPGDGAYYTTDGSDPTAGGAVQYTEPFTLSESATVKAAEYDPVTGLWGSVASADFTINLPGSPAAPVIVPNGGNFNSPQNITVSISASLSGGQNIYYTTNGIDPTVTSSVYSAPFSLALAAGTTTMVKAKVFDPGTGLWSSTATATFTVAAPSHHGGGIDPTPPPPPPVVLPVVTEPEVNTEPASGITLTEARLNGSITSTGGAPCTRVNFRYRLMGDRSWQDTNIQSVSLDDGAQFSATLIGLKPNAKYEFEARAYNTEGWGEGQINFFTTTSAVLPKVVTQAATGVNIDTATLNAAIIDSGGADIADSGFSWGTFDQLGTNMNQVHVPPGADGSLTFNINGLEKNTKYYFQSYATNEAGTGYGDLLTFQTPLAPPMTVITLEATHVGFETATLHGKVEGGGTNVHCGFSISPGFPGEAYVDPAADGSFSVTINWLKPGTTYNFTAFGINEAGRFYASSGMSFTTLTNAPEVETQAPAGVTPTTAELKGFIKKNKGFDITDRGFLWGTDPNPGNRVSTPPGGDGRSLSYSLNGLLGGATYYVQAYAVNSEGTGYGSTVSFTTQPATTPVVTTDPVSFDSAKGGAVLSGSIASGGGAPLTEYGFRYGTDQNSWISLVMGQEHTGDFTSAGIYSLDNLSPGTSYYVQAYAVNQVGPGYGGTVSLAMPGLPVVTGSIDKSANEASSATLAGNITDTGGPGVTCAGRQFQYRLAGSSDWVEVGSEQGSFGPGTFSLRLDGLKPGTSYQFRARAKNSAGWGDSAAVFFATSWGQSDKETALNMKNAGYSAVDIANVLKSDYEDTGAAALEALRYAGFGAGDIASSLKNSSYRCSLQTVVGLLKSAGFDVVAVAGVLQQVFPQEVKWSGHLDLGVALCLKNTGYSIDDVIKAMRAVFNYQLADCADELQGSSPWFSSNTVYGGIARAYGASELANYLWSIKRRMGTDRQHSG